MCSRSIPRWRWRPAFREGGDYLLPDLNEDPPESEGLDGSPTSTTDTGSQLELIEEAARRIAGMGPEGVGKIHRLALRLVRENSRSDGGFVAASFFAASAASRPDAPWLRDVAESFRAAHTFYRDLLPVAKLDPRPQRVGWFVARRLKALGERSGAVVVSESLLDNPPESLSRATFLNVPENRSNTQRYPLPCRHAPSWLQMAAANASKNEFVLQIGEEPPVRFRIETPEMPLEKYRPSRADAALAALNRRAQTLPNEPPITINTAELPLPAAAQKLRLWREPAEPAPLRVALQFQTSRPYRLTESEYRDAVRRAGAGRRAQRVRAGRRPLSRTREAGHA
jgi:hypothetical protein